MKITLLTAHDGNPWPNIGDGFITLAVRRLLSGHLWRELPLHRTLPAAVWAREKSDLVLIGGTNIVGATGTVRCAHTLGRFQSLKCPIVPVGIGAQAKLGERVRLDARGTELLKFWYRSSGAISVRDELTKDAIEKLLGKDSARLTGCPTLFLRWPKRSPTSGPLFIPGPYRNFLSPRAHKHYVGLSLALGTEVLSRAGSLLAQQADGLRSRLPCLFFPQGPEAHLDRIVAADSIVSFRIHPLLVGVVNRVPGLLIALDARTKSMAQAVGIPVLDYRPGLTVEEVLKVWREAVESFPWSRVEERIAELKASLIGHLTSHGLHPADSAQFTDPRLLDGLGVPSRIPSHGMLVLVALLKDLPLGTPLLRIQQIKELVAQKLGVASWSTTERV